MTNVLWALGNFSLKSPRPYQYIQSSTYIKPRTHRGASIKLDNFDMDLDAVLVGLIVVL